MTHENRTQFWNEVRALQNDTEIPFLDNVILVITKEGGLEFRNDVALHIQEQVITIYNNLNY